MAGIETPVRSAMRRVEVFMETFPYFTRDGGLVITVDCPP
jgi:hypothetical protein